MGPAGGRWIRRLQGHIRSRELFAASSGRPPMRRLATDLVGFARPLPSSSPAACRISRLAVPFSMSARPDGLGAQRGSGSPESHWILQAAVGERCPAFAGGVNHTTLTRCSAGPGRGRKGVARSGPASGRLQHAGQLVCARTLIFVLGADRGLAISGSVSSGGINPSNSGRTTLSNTQAFVGPGWTVALVAIMTCAGAGACTSSPTFSEAFRTPLRVRGRSS